MNERCAICGQPISAYHVEWDHYSSSENAAVWQAEYDATVELAKRQAHQRRQQRALYGY